MKVYESIPNQLAKENKKFQYSLINKDAKGREYRDAITWLNEFGLVNICYHINDLSLPLEGNKDDNIFKLYVSDTGLFVSMLGKGTANNILNGDLKIYKGVIFENLVADSFGKNGKDLFYYSKSSNLEIDFVTTFAEKLSLVEVKSTNGNAKSLKSLIDKNKDFRAFKLVDGNLGYSNGIYTIPLYMAFLID